MVEVINKTDRELLVEIATEMKDLKAQFDKVSNGVGFPRCAARGETIKELQTSFKYLRNMTVVVGGGVGVWIIQQVISHVL